MRGSTLDRPKMQRGRDTAETPDAVKHLRVWVILMQFPVPAETFAGTDVLALREHGAVVDVHALRPAHRASEQMVRERGLKDLPISHNTLARSLRGLAYGLTHPQILAQLAGWALAHNWRRPRHLAKTLILSPRVLELYQRLDREKPDVVHLFWGHYPTALGYLVARRQRGMVLSMFLGAYDLVMRYGGSGPVSRMADCVWTHARANLPALRELGVPPDIVRVVHRGIASKLCDGFANTTRMKDRVVTASRLVPGKGVEQVLRTFARLRANRPGATLIVLGDGPERPGLEALASELEISDAVQFRGHVEHREVLRELACAEVFLFLSTKRSERLPNAAKEAMACGCVCVASTSPGMDELIENGVHGVLLPDADPEAAARAVDSLLADEGARTRIAAAAAARIREHFDVSRAVLEQIEVWRRLAAEKSGSTPKAESLATNPTR